MPKAVITTASAAGITAIVALVLQHVAMRHRATTSRRRGSRLHARRRVRACSRIVRKRAQRVLRPCDAASRVMGLTLIAMGTGWGASRGGGELAATTSRRGTASTQRTVNHGFLSGRNEPGWHVANARGPAATARMCPRWPPRGHRRQVSKYRHRNDGGTACGGSALQDKVLLRIRTTTGAVTLACALQALRLNAKPIVADLSRRYRL